MGDGIDLTHACQKFVAQALAFAPQTRDINHLYGRGIRAEVPTFRPGFESRIRDLNHSNAWVNGAKWVVGRLRLTRFGQALRGCLPRWANLRFQLEHNE